MRKRARRSPALASKVLRTSAGYLVAADRTSDGERLTVSAPGGQICLRIKLLREGPVLEVQGQSLSFISDGELRLACDRLAIEARRELSLRAGALDQTVLGDVRLQAGGTVELEGHAQRIRARLGDLHLSANDDVSVEGERVLLNSPKELPPRSAALLPDK